MHADGAAPDLSLVRAQNPACYKVIIAADRLAVFEPDSNDLVTGPQRSVPGTVQRHKSIALEFRWKHFAFVESHAENGRMRLNQYIGDDRFGNKVRAFALPARIFVLPEIRI